MAIMARLQRDECSFVFASGFGKRAMRAYLLAGGWGGETE